MIEIEQWGKMIIWLWSRYIKKKPIPYIDLEFHYPMWMFYLVGGILGGLILGIALFYFTITSNPQLSSSASFLRLNVLSSLN